ncbi:unnamed protein product [Alternaria alternata]
MASSTDESSEYDSGPRSRMEDYHAAHSGRGAPAPATPGADGDKEDLFLNIAADSAPKPQRPAESAAARVDRLKVSAPVRADNMYERIEFSKRTLYPADAPAAFTSGPSQQPAVAPLCAAVALARAVDLSDTNNNKPHTLRCCPGSQVERHTSVIAFAYSLQIRAIPKLACA